MLLSNRAYDIVKRLVQVILPAISALYFGLAAIWGLPAAEQVVGTIAVVTTFLGVTLGISHSNYKASGAGFDGNLVITESTPGKTLFSVEVDDDPLNLAEKDSISLHVVREGPLEVEEV